MILKKKTIQMMIDIIHPLKKINVLNVLNYQIIKKKSDNKFFFVLPITFDFLYLLSPIINMFFLVIFGLILYLIELDIIPNLSVPFINLTQLISLHLYKYINL